MSDAGQPPTNLVALHDERERAIELITERYSQDVIDVDDMEARLERVHAASTLEELAALTADLRAPEPLDEASDETGPTRALVHARPAYATSLVRMDADAVPEKSRSIAIFGDARRDGHWVPAREHKVVNVFGETQLDFRDAEFGPGEFTVRLRSVFGDVILIVPPGLRVDVDCPAILASIKRYESSRDDHAALAHPDDDAPRLRVEGFVALGDLCVDERLPGESRREAKKRRKSERKSERRHGRDDKRRRKREKRRRRD